MTDTLLTVDELELLDAGDDVMMLLLEIVADEVVTPGALVAALDDKDMLVEDTIPVGELSEVADELVGTMLVIFELLVGSMLVTSELPDGLLVGIVLVTFELMVGTMLVLFRLLDGLLVGTMLVPFELLVGSTLVTFELLSGLLVGTMLVMFELLVGTMLVTLKLLNGLPVGSMLIVSEPLVGCMLVTFELLDGLLVGSMLVTFGLLEGLLVGTMLVSFKLLDGLLVGPTLVTFALLKLAGDELDAVDVTIVLLKLPVALAEVLLSKELLLGAAQDVADPEVVPVALRETLLVLKDTVELESVLLRPLLDTEDIVAEIDGSDDSDTLGQKLPVVTTAVIVVVAVFVTIWQKQQLASFFCSKKLPSNLHV